MLDTQECREQNAPTFASVAAALSSHHKEPNPRRRDAENQGENVPFDESPRKQYLPGWTVQCINPDCLARGHWLRADAAQSGACSNCGATLANVPPPLGPRLKLRPRPLGIYRPIRRPR